MDKYDYIEGIISQLQGTTALNFQIQTRVVLAAYYDHKGKKFEMPASYGGDDKNDGYVHEEALFYQIFAPSRMKKSLKKDIQEKFYSDLSKLLKIIYEEGKWGGKLQKFIFLVNTFDIPLPHDSVGYFEKVTKEFKELYDIEFQYEVTNLDHIRILLKEINDIEVLKEVSTRLRVKKLIDCNAIDEEIIIKLLTEVSENIGKQFIGGKQIISYQRISSLEKITINSLENRREEIEDIISKLDVVENAVNIFNQDIQFGDKFERVKDTIIDRYYKLSKIFAGTELYDELVVEMLKYSKERWNFETAMKFLVVYIFDKCDIFEKVRG